MNTTPSRASGERSSGSCDAPSPIGDSLLRVAVAQARAEVLEQSLRPRDLQDWGQSESLFDEIDAIFAQHPQSVGAPVPDDAEITDARVAVLLDDMSWQGHPDNMSLDEAGSLWVWAQDAAAELRRLAAAPTAPVSPEHHLFGELMAVMHSDGGHYLAEHGAKKSFDDALTKWYALVSPRERNEGGGDAVAWMVEWTDEDDGKPIRIAFEYRAGAENRRDEAGGDARVFPLFTHPAPTASDDAKTPEYRLQCAEAFGEQCMDDIRGLIAERDALQARLDATLTAQSEGGLREAIWNALDALASSHVQDNKHRLGVLGAGDVNMAMEFLSATRNTPPAPDAAGREPLCDCHVGEGMRHYRGKNCPTPPPAAPEQADPIMADFDAKWHESRPRLAQPWAPVTDVEVEAMLAAPLWAGCVNDFLYVSADGIENDEAESDVAQAMGNALLALRGGLAQGVVVDGVAKGRNPFLQTVLDNLAEALDEHEDCWSGYAHEVNGYLGLPKDASPWPTLEQWRRERAALAPQQSEGRR